MANPTVFIDVTMDRNMRHNKASHKRQILLFFLYRWLLFHSAEENTNAIYEKKNE